MTLRDGVTVLIGKNGAGKSSIIEAITFNLYGKVKQGTNKDTIRRVGADDSEKTYTSIDFHIGDIHYRCRRYLSPKGTTIASLYSYTEEEYENLLLQKDKTALDKTLGTELGTSTTGVTDKICQLLGVSYDGFKASFVAPQKGLDSLASLTLENRKKFFLDLLGYSRLDKIKTEISSEVNSLKGTTTILERQSIDINEVEEQIKTITEQLKSDNASLNKGLNCMEKWDKELTGLNNQYQQLELINEKILDTEQRNQKATAALKEKKELFSELEEAIKKNTKLSKGYDEKSSISQRLVEVSEKLQRASIFSFWKN